MIEFVGIILGMFGISVMQLILATAMPFIVTEIGGDALYGWVFSSYMLASLLTIPVFSKMADLFGKKRFYLIGLGFFAAGTLYGGLAPNMPSLIAARVIQGLGAGMIVPVSMALVSDLFPEEKRGNMIAVFGMVQLLANLLSPLLGSFFTKQLGWHWIFFTTLCLIAVSMGLVATSKRAAPTMAQPGSYSEVDLAGGLVFGVFCVLVVGFSKVAGGGSGLATVLLLAGAALAALALFGLETRHKNPIIKVAFFKSAVLRRSIFSAIISGGVMYGLVTILPLCGIILNRSGLAIDESRILFVFMLGLTLGMLASSRLMKRLNAAFTKSLWSVSLAGAGLLVYALGAGNFVLFEMVIAGTGLCLGGIMATLLINSQNAVDSADRTVLSGLVQLGRYLGASVGVTILTGMLPEVSQITNIVQFLGAFGLLAGMYAAGLVNEWL